MPQLPLIEWLLVAMSLGELVLLLAVSGFFLRLRRSEESLSRLQSRQAELLNRLQFNAQLEHELMSTFESRQAELVALDERLGVKAKELGELIKQAEKFARSPQFLREIIHAGHKRGQSAEALARALNLSRDEVELILDQIKTR